MNDEHTLHDAGVILPPRESLAHSLSDEAYPPRPPIEPIITTWAEAGKILALSGLILIAFGVFMWALLLDPMGWMR